MPSSGRSTPYCVSTADLCNAALLLIRPSVCQIVCRQPFTYQWVPSVSNLPVSLRRQSSPVSSLGPHRPYSGSRPSECNAPLPAVCVSRPRSMWSFYVPLFGTLVILGLLFWKRHSHPANFILLSVFTLFEAFTLGVTVAFFNPTLVLQAL